VCFTKQPKKLPVCVSGCQRSTAKGNKKATRPFLGKVPTLPSWFGSGDKMATKLRKVSESENHTPQ